MATKAPDSSTGPSSDAPSLFSTFLADLSIADPSSASSASSTPDSPSSGDTSPAPSIASALADLFPATVVPTPAILAPIADSVAPAPADLFPATVAPALPPPVDVAFAPPPLPPVVDLVPVDFVPADPADLAPAIPAPALGPIRGNAFRVLRFFKGLLDQSSDVVAWVDKQNSMFQFRNTKKVAELYKEHTKNKKCTFDSMMRNFRLYRANGFIKKIDEIRCCWQVLDNSVWATTVEPAEQDQLLAFLMQPSMLEQMAMAMQEFQQFEQEYPMLNILPLEDKIRLFYEWKVKMQNTE
uniref:ETS domain-containing protein n=1 Tax=Caenorhabditis tropicalis TaxID=1561998 RepID=A0A1I7UIP5_9PELO